MITEIFKALSDENRIRIFNLLQNNELCVCEIETILNLNQTNTSHHLAKLKSAGIFEMRREYQCLFYKIAKEFMPDNKNILDYLAFVLQKDERCMLDSNKLKKYKENGFNCEKLKLNKMDVLSKIKN